MNLENITHINNNFIINFISLFQILSIFFSELPGNLLYLFSCFNLLLLQLFFRSLIKSFFGNIKWLLILSFYELLFQAPSRLLSINNQLILANRKNLAYSKKFFAFCILVASHLPESYIFITFFLLFNLNNILCFLIWLCVKLRPNIVVCLGRVCESYTSLCWSRGINLIEIFLHILFFPWTFKSTFFLLFIYLI